MLKKHLKVLSATLAFLLFTSLWLPPVQASYRRSSLKAGGFSILKSKDGKVCYLNHKELGSLALLPGDYKETKQQKQSYLERLLGIRTMNKPFDLFSLYQPTDVGRYNDEDPTLILGDSARYKEERAILPIIPLTEEKANGNGIAAVQMLLNHRQVYHSQDEIATLLNYNLESGAGIDIKRIPPVLNQELWGYENPSDLTQAGYHLKTLGQNKEENVELFKEHLLNDMYDGYPLLAEINGKAGLQADIYEDVANANRTVIVIGYLVDLSEFTGSWSNVQGIYYIEAHPDCQKLFWGGLHYLPLEDFVDAISKSKSQSYIW